MKKAKGAVLGALLLTGALGAAYFKSRPTPFPYDLVGKIPNARHTGNVIFIGTPGIDQFRLFVSDSKGPRHEAFYLGEHRYSSTQGCDSLYWSKDHMMCAIYSEGTEIFDHLSPWVGGYDWKTHQILAPSQIAWAFASHGGKGKDGYPENFNTATPQEIKLFGLKNRNS